jgi:hypothetical protein
MNSGAARPAFPAACRRRSTFLTCPMVWSVRVAGAVRSTSMSAAHAVRRCPTAATNWYSHPGTVLLLSLQWHAPSCTWPRPGEQPASGRG